MGKHTYVPSSCKELVSVLCELSERHSIWDVFQDWLAVSAIAISNAVDWNQRAARETMYLEITNKYDRQEQAKLAEALGLLVNTLQRELEISGPTDILGQVFHTLELHNEYRGQFFTPPTICEAMGRMTLGADLPDLSGKGFISVCEPCIGSGGMILGFAKAMQDCKLNYCKQMLVTGCDIDLKCVHMAYLQLSLLGIPAVIIHGNSLTVEEWSRWYTPAYMLDLWLLKAPTTGLVDIKSASRYRRSA